MIFSTDARLDQLVIHHVGNKARDQHFSLSERPLEMADELLASLLKSYFLLPAEKVSEIYRFFHSSGDRDLNEVFHFAATVFADPTSFYENSVLIAKHLHETAVHPKINAGELYVVLFNDVQVEGALHQALGIFKSENKETYLKVVPGAGMFGISYEQEAVNIHKLDKGCLIFDTEKEEGYKVAIFDQSGRSSDAVYWKDDFLQLQIRNDSFTQTQALMGMCKSFVTDKLDEKFEISRPDKIDLLNRSMKYFKEKESFDLDDFSAEVIGNPAGMELFREHKRTYESDFDTVLPDTFDISGAAVKKQAKVFKSVLKLDKNFHVYIHGNKELIERGFDEEKNMNYYKIFFREEQ